MTNPNYEQQTELSQNLQELESNLRMLWDKARQAAEVIQALRAQNQSLMKTTHDLELKAAFLEREIGKRERDIIELKNQLEAVSKDGLGNLSNDEKAELKEKIKVLIDKINSHL